MINAYGRIGVSVDILSQAMRMLERNMHTKSEAMIETAAKVGVEIKVNEDLKTTYFKVIEALKLYKEGHDRNQAAMDMLGTRVQNVNSLLRVNAEDVDNSAEHLKKLGLNFDDVSLNKARAFKAGMHDAGLQLDAIKYKIGEMAIPALTSLGRAFIWVTDQIKAMATAESSAEAGIAALSADGGRGVPQTDLSLGSGAGEGGRCL